MTFPTLAIGYWQERIMALVSGQQTDAKQIQN